MPLAASPATLGARKPKRGDEEKKELECIICFGTDLDADDIAASAARSCGCKALMHLLCLQRWKDTQQDYNGLCFVCGIAID